MRRVLMILLLGLFFVGLGSAGFTEIDFTGFEIGLDGWSDPGDDVTRNTDRSYCTDTTCSNGGTWTLEIKDNDANSYSEQTFDLSTPCNGEACDYVMLSFWAFY